MGNISSPLAARHLDWLVMTNHVHLLITPERKESASLMMKNLGQCYVQFINKAYSRSGTLWEGRFKSCLAEDDRYVLSCYRYIELNPVRAGMVSHPADYPWSSYRCNSEGSANSIITAHTEYLQLNRLKEERLRAYRNLVEELVDEQELEKIRAATNGNFVLGSARFQREIESALGRRTHRGKPGRPAKSR